MSTTVEVSKAAEIKAKNAAKAKAAKAKAAAAKKESPYKKYVLAANKNLKTEQKSLGGSIKFIQLFKKEAKLDARRIKALNFMQKNDDAYKRFQKVTRKSSKGNYCAFYVLQALNKNLAQIEIDNGWVKES